MYAASSHVTFTVTLINLFNIHEMIIIITPLNLVSIYMEHAIYRYPIFMLIIVAVNKLSIKEIKIQSKFDIESEFIFRTFYLHHVINEWQF